MTHIIVHRSHPIQYYGIRLLFLILAASLLWGAFELGYMQSEEDIIESKGGHKSLIMQQNILKKKNVELSKEFLQLERKHLLDKESCQLVQLGMNKDQAKIRSLEKELAFYKGIVSPTLKHKSIYLYSMEIKQVKPGKEPEVENSEQLFHYQFTIAQTIKKNSYTEGLIKIFIKGKIDGKEVKHSLVSLSETKLTKEEDKKKGFKFSFKYFQEFNGIMRLPEGMIPHSVDIIIDTKKKKSVIELGDLQWSQTGGMKYVGQ